ncbi:hypothetical protein [Rhizosphaericola mali]|uniref:Uncharacterized protein n=1 Tax=Rhizosphaericola mali TaxID=2545455 RepID=A0A5P2GCN6_9BACT|nr:hypothetical protein [Rhizosphaericola mali]QES89341.1 hypothetical protein E0W69_011935 [Rhizosphaericola mali]
MIVGAFFTRKSFAQNSKNDQNNVPVTSHDFKTRGIDTIKSMKANDKMLKMPQKYTPTTLGGISFSGIPEKKKKYILDNLKTKNKTNSK